MLKAHTVPSATTRRRSGGPHAGFGQLRHVAPAFALLAALGALGARGQEFPFLETVRRSGFIFIGTVEAVGEATPSIPPRPESAVVVVDQVLEALPPVGDPTGQRVTVRLLDPRSARPGEQVAFFTYVQSAGETLELIQVAQAPPDAEALSDRIAAARRELGDRALAARLESALLVVLGTVAETEPAPEAGRPESEHDPLWWRARIDVEAVEKGRPTTAPLPRVYFATNVDYLWAEAPKLVEGERAILLLQPDPDPQDEVSGLFLLDSLDKLPVTELERVRRLLGAPR